MDRASIERAPKAELHVHLEGAWPWETIRRFHPDGRRLPERPPWLTESARLDFDAFVRIFREHVLPSFASIAALEAGGRDLVAWLDRCGVRYVEFTDSGDFMELRGIRFEDGMPALHRAVIDEGARRGIAVRMFAGLKRNYSPDLSARWMERWLSLGKDLLHGIDLMGYERLGPAAPHKKAYDMARQAGLRLKAHAGEHGGPDQVWEAMDVLGATHIGHGAQAIEDPALVRELARRGVVLNMCPTSNVILGVCRTMEEHPIRALFDAGVRVTVSTDDPLIFGNDLNGEYLALHRSLGFTPGELRRIARTGFEEAMVTESERTRLLSQVDAAFTG